MPSSASLPIFKQFVVLGNLSVVARKKKKKHKNAVNWQVLLLSTITGVEISHPLRVGA